MSRAAGAGAARGGPVWVVVVHHGDPAPTLACLRSIAGDPSAAARRVVVVDNSGDLDPEALPAGVLHLRCRDNPGYGGGVHRGIEQLEAAAKSGDAAPAALLALNHDVVLAPGYLDACVELFAADEAIGAGGGPIHRDRLGGELWYAGGALRRLTGTVRQSREPGDARRARDVGFIPGTALAIRPAAWREVGGFDPRIFLYHEDLDLCLRLRRAGWRLRFDPALAVAHRLGAATGSANASPLYLEQLTATRLAPFRGPYRLYLALLHSGWVALRAARWALAGDRRRVAALLSGHRRALAGWRGGRRAPHTTPRRP